MNFKLFTLSILAIMLVSCAKYDHTSIDEHAKNIQEKTNNIIINSEVIENLANDTTKKADETIQIANGVPQPQKNEIITKQTDIKSNQKQIVGAAKSSKSDATYIFVETEKIQKVNQYNSAYVNKLENDKITMMEWLLYGTISISIITTAVGIFLFLYSKDISGVWVATTGLIMAAGAYFVSQYITYIMIGIGVLFTGVIIYILYIIFVQNKGLEQIVYGVQRLKNNDNKEQVNQLMDDVQDDTTKSLIKKVKSKI